jgi:hypothetical protein
MNPTGMSEVEGGMVLQDAHGRLDRHRRAATLAEGGPPRRHRPPDALTQVGAALRRIGAGAAVDDEGRHSACHARVGSHIIPA